MPRVSFKNGDPVIRVVPSPTEFEPHPRLQQFFIGYLDYLGLEEEWRLKVENTRIIEAFARGFLEQLRSNPTMKKWAVSEDSYRSVASSLAQMFSLPEKTYKLEKIDEEMYVETQQTSSEFSIEFAQYGTSTSL